MVEAYECPLCLDVFEAPIIINCGNNHRYLFISTDLFFDIHWEFFGLE